jgi:hypothetical protein
MVSETLRVRLRATNCSKKNHFLNKRRFKKGDQGAPKNFDRRLSRELHERVLQQLENAAYLRHGLRSIASRQNAGSIAQHDQSAWILRNPTSVDRPSDRQVVVPVNDLFLAGVMRAFPEQFYGVFAFGF